MDFKEHLKKYLSEEEIDKLIDSLNYEDRHALLLNAKKMSEDNLLKIYPHLEKHPIVKNGYLYDKNEYQLGKSILHELGAFYLQEPSAMIVSYLLNPSKYSKVLDLCAAPGGKTVQSSFIMDDSGLIISNDLSYPRSKIIKENVERLGLGNILVISNDFSKIYQKYNETFDYIILDAPCSGSGMFRKNDLMKEDWSINKVYKFSSLQKELILMCYKMLKKGGKMVYSTCSFSYEEDEEVISYLLDNTNAKHIEIESNLYFYKDKSKLGIHLFPHLFPGEGHYIAIIEKEGNNEIKEDIINKKKYKIYDNRILNKYNELLYLTNTDFPIKDFNVIRNGVKLGEENKDGIKYDIHYARNINSFPRTLELNKEQTIEYLKGESLNIKTDKGYILLKYLGVNIDIGKSDGEIIKNRYPKYLRKNNIID